MEVVIRDGPSDITLHLGGTHIETEYIWHSMNDMVEFGYFTDRWQDGTYDAPALFDAMMLQGDYRGPRDHSDAFAQNSLHTLTLVWRENEQRYGFKVDGDFLNALRDSGWTSGHPNAGVEVSYQCKDEAHAHFDNVQRKRNDGQWTDWNSTNYACDLLYHWGYDPHTDTHFDVSSRGEESIPISPVGSEDDSCRPYLLGWGD